MGWYGLSDSEHEIMKYIWKHEEVTLREVVAWLENRGYTWKQQTVYTLLNRLIDKGAITAIKKGNYRLYYPAITEDELIGQWTENLVENEYQGCLLYTSSNRIRNLPCHKEKRQVQKDQNDQKSICRNIHRQQSKERQNLLL